MPQLKIPKTLELPKSIIIQNYYIHDGIKYMVDNKNVIINVSQKELEVAKWLVDNFGGVVKILPKINWPENIQTADYIFQGEKWDLKELKNATSRTRAIDNVIKDRKKQSSNFIIDISDCRLSDNLILNQVRKVFNPHNTQRLWVNKIIVKRYRKIIKIFKRK